MALRKDGQAILNTQQMQGVTAETWIGFLSHDEKDASDSVYSGQQYADNLEYMGTLS